MPLSKQRLSACTLDCRYFFRMESLKWDYSTKITNAHDTYCQIILQKGCCISLGSHRLSGGDPVLLHPFQSLGSQLKHTHTQTLLIPQMKDGISLITFLLSMVYCIALVSCLLSCSAQLAYNNSRMC